MCEGLWVFRGAMLRQPPEGGGGHGKDSSLIHRR